MFQFTGWVRNSAWWPFWRALRCCCWPDVMSIFNRSSPARSDLTSAQKLHRMGPKLSYNGPFLTSGRFSTICDVIASAQWRYYLDERVVFTTTHFEKDIKPEFGNLFTRELPDFLWKKHLYLNWGTQNFYTEEVFLFLSFFWQVISSNLVNYLQIYTYLALLR